MHISRGLILAFIALCVMLFSGLAPQRAVAQARVKISSLTVSLEGEICFVHTVRRKQTLYSIAAAYGVSQNDIISKNPQAERGIKRGQTLLIPMLGGSSHQAKETEREGAKAASEAPKVERKNSEQQINYIEPSVASQPLLPIVEVGVGANTISEEQVVAIDDALYANSGVLFGLTREVDVSKPLKVVMLLPFGASVAGDENFAEFYRGALIGFEELADLGANINLEVISTAKSVGRMSQIIESGALRDANLIIGPIYDEEFEVVAPYAAHNRIAIVSPLGSVGRANNAFVVEVAPTSHNKWDKVVPMLSDVNSNVILIEHQSAMDSAAMQELAPHIPLTAHRVQYVDKMTNVLLLKNALVRDKNNIIVAPIMDEIAVEEILARYSSINAASNYNISVVGTSRWSRFARLNIDLFFKLRVHYPTTYFFDRMNPLVAPFYNKYLTRFSGFPTFYTFRGYDMASIFGSLLFSSGDKMMYELIKDTPSAMQTPYLFDQSSDTTKIVNIDWPMVQYLPDYNIEVK